jgi:hypothetical protein
LIKVHDERVAEKVLYALWALTDVFMQNMGKNFQLSLTMFFRKTLACGVFLLRTL